MTSDKFIDIHEEKRIESPTPQQSSLYQHQHHHTENDIIISSSSQTHDERIHTALKEISGLYRLYGTSDYIGESITQVQHATQCAYMATRAKANEESIIAALLHDCGHLLGMQGNNPNVKQMMSHDNSSQLGVVKHEIIGAEWLQSLGLSSTICQLVARHVDAKRYLCYSNPAYIKKLSPASQQTLIHQGGIMTGEEAKEFDTDPLKNIILRMRDWDDKAKDPDAVVPDFDTYLPMIQKYIS